MDLFEVVRLMLMFECLRGNPSINIYQLDHIAGDLVTQLSYQPSPCPPDLFITTVQGCLSRWGVRL